MTTVILVIAVLFITFLARLSAAESGASVVDSDYIEDLDPFIETLPKDLISETPVVRIDPLIPETALCADMWAPDDDNTIQ